jgi:membrane protein DedA with SNARE-associated domain
VEQVLDFVGRHGGPIVFVTVFLDQLGLPIPTIPILLAFGALAGTGQISPLWGLLTAVVASVVADLVLFQLGRWKGARLLASLCRVSLEPDSCVS